MTARTSGLPSVIMAIGVKSFRVVWQRLEQEWIGGDWGVAGAEKGLAVGLARATLRAAVMPLPPGRFSISKRLLVCGAERRRPAASRYLGGCRRACWQLCRRAPVGHAGSDCALRDGAAKPSRNPAPVPHRRRSVGERDARNLLRPSQPQPLVATTCVTRTPLPSPLERGCDRLRNAGHSGRGFFPCPSSTSRALPPPGSDLGLPARIVVAEHDVIDAEELDRPFHAERMRRHGVGIESLQIDAWVFGSWPRCSSCPAGRPGRATRRRCAT